MEEILVIEDDELLNDGLCFHLQKKGYHALPAYDLKQADFLIETKSWSLFLLDINFPDGSGLSFAKKIRKKSIAPIVFLTAQDMDEDMIQGFEAGADDYITKPFNILEVKARIKAIIRRSSQAETKEPQKVYSYGGLRIDIDSRRGYINDIEVNLTAKEFDLLELLMLHPNKVYGREELLNTVWGYDYPGDVRTVDVHIRRLREKIEESPSNPSYIHTKWGVGYYFQK